MRNLLSALVAVALVHPLALAAASSTSTAPTTGPTIAPEKTHAVWITRFDYRTRADVEAIVRDCAKAGFDTLMWQVRGNATAFYDSPYEPWGEQIGGADPGFDPLKLACELARREGLAIHAWVNVMPAWWGLEPPTDPKQLVNAHPEWLWYDQHGERQPYSERFYVSVNPCLPEVRSYLVLVMADLVRRYPVDGLHLDYVRFPNEFPATPSPELDYPRDARTLALFKEETGLHPDASPERWDRWRADCLTDLVRRIGNAAKGARPAIVYSAAVTPLPAMGERYHQDIATWISEGYFDALFPMNYSGDPKVFGERLAPWRAARAKGTRIVMGVRIDVDGGTAEQRVRRSLEEFDGFCAFAYSSLFDSANVDLTDQSIEAREARARRRAEWLPLLQGTSGS